MWTPLPLLHPGPCEGTSTSWAEVDKLGLTGFTGDDGSLPGFGSGPSGPGREIEAFVKSRWSEDEWETAWCELLVRIQADENTDHLLKNY